MKNRDEVIALLGRHDYGPCTDDLTVARVDGPGEFDERIAVHQEGDRLTLWVRRGGIRNLKPVAREIGGTPREEALEFRNLDLNSLDATIAKLKGALRRHPMQ